MQHRSDETQATLAIPASGTLFVIDARTKRVKHVSDGAAALFGADPIRAVDDLASRMVEPERGALLDAFRAVAESGGTRACTYALVDSCGNAHLLRTELFAAGGDVIAYTADATEGLDRARRLDQAEVILDAIAQNSPVAVFAIDRCGVLRYARGGGRTRLGDRARVEGTSVLQLYGDAPWMMGALRRALAGESGVAEGEVDGTHWDIYYSALRAASGDVHGVVGVAVDGMLRKKAEEALFKVFHASPVATSITRLDDGQFLEVNESFVAMFGYPREELLGQTSLGLHLWADEGDRERILERLARDQRVRGYEATGLTKQGRRIDSVIFMERIELAKTPAIVGLFLDITERKRAERELQALYDQLRELDELKARFVANVSHELRTPLSLVLGLADRMLDAGDLPASRRADIEAIRRNARAVLKHVNDLLDVSKIEAGGLQVDYADVDLARVVANAASSFALVAKTRDVRVDLELPATLRAEVDPDMVARIATNLLSNAVKYTPSGGRVRCTLSADGERAILEVADSGPGIPPAARSAIFERFVQLDRGLDRRFSGTGLGLPIARELATLHRGGIEVTTAPEGGALFRVEVPLRAPAGTRVRPPTPAPLIPVDVDMELAAPLAPSEKAPDRGLPRVLLVEDNDELSRFVAESLAPRYDVTRARDADEALRVLDALSPDALVTDLMMPGMSGVDLVKAVRQRGIHDGMPIIVVTARAEDELRTRLLESGAQDYVLKPFSRAELVARVGNWTATYRARRLLQEELTSRSVDVEELASELARRRHDLEATAESLRVAREQAERASRDKSDFLSMISHELRTPLTAIQLQVQILARHASSLSAPQRATLDRMDRGCARLLALVESLLEYARSQTGRVRVRAESFDLGACAAEVADELRPEAQRKGIDLRADIAPGLSPLFSDRRLVRIVLGNLLANAVKFTEHGSVSVAISESRGMHVICVSDSGVGIPDEQQGVVFEPFAQLEPLARKHLPGFGLGLALVRQIVAMLGGSIELASRVGVGSTFTVRLPPALAPRASAATDAPQ